MALKLERAETRISKLREDAMKNVEQISLDAAEAMIARLGVKASRADVKKAVSSVLETRR
jgi:F-type H+-transporting ATPase subunit b